MRPKILLRRDLVENSSSRAWFHYRQAEPQRGSSLSLKQPETMWAHDNNQEPASRWLWQSGRDAWTAFAPNQASALEEAWATGGGVVRIDAERQVRVDTSGVPMRQERVDNPGRSRAVKRENGGAQEGKRPRLTPAAPSATADADGGGGGGVSPAASGPPLAWRLNRLGEQWSRVLPSSVNTDSVSLDELLSAVELQGATQLHLHNFLFDLDFVFETCPALGSFVASGGLVKVFHGDGRPPRSVAATTMPAAVECFEPPTEQFGTMHSKCIVVVRPSRLSVHVITANFIFSVARVAPSSNSRGRDRTHTDDTALSCISLGLF